MNTKVILTKNTFEGRIVLTYNHDGLLVGYLMEAEFNHKQLAFFLQMIPVDMIQLKTVLGVHGFDAVEEIAELTFDYFYEEYGYKTGKVKAQNAWNRLSKSDRMKALQYLPKYFDFLRKSGGIAKLYPATYLNQKRWED